MSNVTSVRLRWLAFFLIVPIFGAVLAGDNVLIQYIPKGADRAQVLAIVKQAFAGRHWTIKGSDDTSVSAELSHRRYEVSIKVIYSGDSLRYEDSTTERVADPDLAPLRKKVRAPEGWLNFLRSDISEALSALPASTPSIDSLNNPDDVARRLKVLDGLRASGLVTEDEYKKKRAEILSDL